MKLVNFKEMIKKAHEGHYAVPHININNLEWTKAALETAQENQSPIILATSEGAIKYMGGVHVIVGMVNGLLEDLKITIPVSLHLDHGGMDMALKCIEVGYTSIMYDGSHEPFEINYANIKKVLVEAHKHNVSVEAEVGTIGGEEDGVIGSGELANPVEFKKVAELHVDALAAGINNIHGQYPANWTGLRFDVLKELQSTYSIPMVLHGGSGIPSNQIKKAISLGISKINVNTECQLAFTHATAKYFAEGKDKLDKGFDPRKVISPGYKAIKEIIKEKMIEFGSVNKA